MSLDPQATQPPGPPTDKNIYLSKDGQTFGPFSSQDLDRMRQSGEIKNYSWQWNDSSRSWVPLDAPSAPPAPAAAQTPAQSLAGVTRPTPQQLSKPKFNIQAICHSQQAIVSGQLVNSTKDGFVLHSTDYSSSMPPFGKGIRVSVNLLDEASGKTENTSAVVLGVARQSGKWEYQLKWEQLPAMLAGMV